MLHAISRYGSKVSPNEVSPPHTAICKGLSGLLECGDGHLPQLTCYAMGPVQHRRISANMLSKVWIALSQMQIVFIEALRSCKVQSIVCLNSEPRTVQALPAGCLCYSDEEGRDHVLGPSYQSWLARLSFHHFQVCETTVNKISGFLSHTLSIMLSTSQNTRTWSQGSAAIFESDFPSSE
jgi:hypothetical protein